jgi:hypothetical protein
MGHRLTRPGQVVRARGELALVKPRRCRPHTAGKRRRLQRGPCPIRVALCAMAWAVALAVAEGRPVPTAARRGSIPNRGKAGHMAGCPRAGRRSKRPDASAREPRRRGWRREQTLADGLCPRCARLAQTVKDGQAAGDGQALRGIRKPGPQLWRGQLAPPLDTDTRTGMAHQAMVDPAHMGGVLTPAGRAFA